MGESKLVPFDELVKEIPGLEERFQNRHSEMLLKHFLGQAFIRDAVLLYIDPLTCKVGGLVNELPYSTSRMDEKDVSGLIKKVKELSWIDESKKFGIFYVKLNTAKFLGGNYHDLVEIKEQSEAEYRIEVSLADYPTRPCEMIQLSIHKI